MPRRKTAKQLRETAVVIRHAGRVVVQRRAAGEWWEGLWDFPRAMRGEAKVAGDRRRGEVTYTVTHHRVTCRVVERHACDAPTTGPACRLVTLAALEKLAMTAPGRRIAAILTE